MYLTPKPLSSFFIECIVVIWQHKNESLIAWYWLMVNTFLLTSVWILGRVIFFLFFQESFNFGEKVSKMLSCFGHQILDQNTLNVDHSLRKSLTRIIATRKYNRFREQKACFDLNIAFNQMTIPLTVILRLERFTLRN